MKIFLQCILLLTVLNFGFSCSKLNGSEQSLSYLTDTSESDPVNPPSPTPALTYATDILLFNGVGISTSDWQSLEKIIQSMGLKYRLKNSTELDAMTIDEISNFGLILIPGGHSTVITSGLSPATRVRIRQAVRDRGVSYFGICAGAWVGVGNEALTDQISSYGFAVIQGSHLASWSPNGNSSLVAAVTPVTFADGAIRNLVWWGGPATPEWKSGVVARYDNGKAAISEGWANQGFVILSGPHPEAPQGWRATAGNDPDGLDYELTKTLIRAALARKPLPTF